eukprot:4723154-Prymnesium_polylepis.1
MVAVQVRELRAMSRRPASAVRKWDKLESRGRPARASESRVTRRPRAPRSGRDRRCACEKIAEN